MQRALEGFLAGSGLHSIREELGRFFGAPVSYEMALRSRLIAHLAARGREKLKDDRNAALELFNRVLTLDPKNSEVLAEIEKLSRQRKWVNTAILVGSLLLLGAGALAARKLIIDRRGGSDSPALATSGGGLSDAGAMAVAPDLPGDAAPTATVADAAPVKSTRVDAGPRKIPNGGGGEKKPPDRKDAGASAPEPSKRTFTLRVNPSNVDATSSVGGGASMPVRGEATIQVPAGEVAVTVKSENRCCKPASKTIKASDTGGPIVVELPFNPGTVTPVCKAPGAGVTIDTKYAELARPKEIAVDPISGSTRVKVEFTLPDLRADIQTVVVKPGEAKDVTCGTFE